MKLRLKREKLRNLEAFLREKQKDPRVSSLKHSEVS
jgi:hypothetical protein